MTATDTTTPTAEATDADLLDACRAGDPAAFDALFVRYRDVAGRVARRIALPATADDLVADAFVAVYAALRAGHGPTEAFGAYLLTSLRRLAARRAADRTTLLAAYDGVDPDRVLIDRAPSPEGTVLRSAESALIRSAFALLPERHRHVLWLVEVEGLTYQEAARRMDVTATVLQSVLKSARRALGDGYLEAHLSEPEAPDAGHPSARELSRLARGRLRPAQRRDVDGHLDGCVPCALRRDEAVSRGSTLRALGLPGLLVPLVVPTHGLSTIPLGERMAAYAPRLGGSLAGAAAVVTAAVLLGTAGPGATAPGPAGMAPATTTADSSVPGTPAVDAQDAAPERAGGAPVLAGPAAGARTPGAEAPAGPATPTLAVSYDPGTDLSTARAGDVVDVPFTIHTAGSGVDAVELHVTTGPGVRVDASDARCRTDGDTLVCGSIAPATVTADVRGTLRLHVLADGATLPTLAVRALP